LHPAYPKILGEADSVALSLDFLVFAVELPTLWRLCSGSS
jgi:hypothetical protein